MNKDDRNTPDALKGFVSRPAPPYLRTNVLTAAKGIRPAYGFLTSAQWGMAAACVLLILGALSGDAFISVTQARRLDTILNDRLAESAARNSDRAGLEELLGADQARSLRLQPTRPRHNQAIWMEGRMDKDALAFEEKEDADVHSKNPR
jgi:hypothetical protein